MDFTQFIIRSISFYTGTRTNLKKKDPRPFFCYDFVSPSWNFSGPKFEAFRNSFNRKSVTNKPLIVAYRLEKKGRVYKIP